MALNLLLKDLVKLNYSCFATSFTTLIELFTAGWYSPEEKSFFQQRIKGSQVLLIDDVGKEMKSKIKLPESTFDDVLRYRVNHARPTFITTNMSPREMLHGYGSAILSLVSEVSMTHELFGVGEDFRPRVQRRHLTEIESGLTRPIY
jgi:DNA replication protein DnaC